MYNVGIVKDVVYALFVFYKKEKKMYKKHTKNKHINKQSKKKKIPTKT